jgi:hypothetical protein
MPWAFSPRQITTGNPGALRGAIRGGAVIEPVEITSYVRRAALLPRTAMSLSTRRTSQSNSGSGCMR